MRVCEPTDVTTVVCESRGVDWKFAGFGTQALWEALGERKKARIEKNRMRVVYDVGGAARRDERSGTRTKDPAEADDGAV